MELPEGFSGAFTGFDMTDDEVGQGTFRAVAIELKHNIEASWIEADEANEEYFLSDRLTQALTNFLKQPEQFQLAHVLMVSPSLREALTEIAMLVSPSVLEKIPVII